MFDPFDRETNPPPAVAAPSGDSRGVRPARSRRLLYALAVGAVALAVASWLPAFSEPDHGQMVTQVEAALTQGEYAQALTHLAKARNDGLPDYRIKPLRLRAQAGPLLDVAQAHLAAGRLLEAQGALDAVQDISPNCLRGLTIQHQLLRQRGVL